MKKDEFTIVLKDINEKLATLVEGHKLLNEKMDRRDEENKVEHQELRSDILLLRKEVFDIKKDLTEVKKELTDHRDNTELHTGKKKGRA